MFKLIFYKIIDCCVWITILVVLALIGLLVVLALTGNGPVRV
jgi:hypothetical protein